MGYNPDKHHRRSIRLRNWNYTNAGSYFVTICCKNRKCLFGKIVLGKMILNEYGEIAFNEWANTIKIRPNVKLHEFVVMPNHFHGIVEIRGVCDTPLRQRYANAFCSPSNTVGAIIRGYKSAVTKQIWARGCMGVLHTPIQPNAPIMPNAPKTPILRIPIWQRNYYEHIIRNDTEYARIARYINNNPILWKGDCFY